MKQVNQVQQQIAQLQQQLSQIEDDMKKKEEKVVESNSKIKLIVSDKEFISSSRTLFNKKNGTTFFVEEYMRVNQHQNEGVDNDKDDIKLEQSKTMNETELFIDRDPEFFAHILNYLRGYNLQDQLNQMKVVELAKLRDDAAYYKVESLYNLVTSLLNARFDATLSSPLVNISHNGIVATRSSTNVNLHHSAAVYGTLEMPTNGSIQRYVEFNIISHADQCIMIGVTEATPFKPSQYPGYATTPGCSYFGENGYLYRSGSYEGWGSAWTYGDSIGVLVTLNKDNDTATVAFYFNGNLVKNALDLKTYMNVNNGVRFVANMYAANDQVQIVQNAVAPQ